MNILKLIANLPWTTVGILLGLLSGIKSIKIHRNPPALVLNIRSFWYRTWLKANKGVRASVAGNVVLLGSDLQPNDLEHELVHIEQIMREPFIQPILYWRETKKHGYRNNKYEVEAYDTTGSIYFD